MAPREKDIIEKVREILRDEFKLHPYLSFKIQSLDDIMSITKELSSSDYFLFIDFKRELQNDKPSLPISLYSHQELALARHLEFKEVMAFKEKGTPSEGFLRYMLTNPDEFENQDDLLEKIKQRVKERNWNPDYSRNLIISEIGFTGPTVYGDHTGQYVERVWQIRIENKRRDISAQNTVCILDYVMKSVGSRTNFVDRSYLKWAGQKGYNRTILPEDYGDIDLFSIHADERGVFLHSLRDTPKQPIIVDDGDYELSFKLFSENFPLLKFKVKLKFRWHKITQTWPLDSEAHLERN